jgi:hypothetical protein
MSGRDNIVLRRPLLHIIVLFASDLRVLNYAKNVSHKFMDAGIDTFVNVSISPTCLCNTEASVMTRHIRRSIL